MINDTHHDLRHLLYLAQVVEARDPYTAGHLWRVAQFSKRLAKQIGMTGNDLFHITLGAYLHDIGKITIPDQILNKKDRLTEDEMSQMRTHADMGYFMLKQHHQAETIAGLARYHHEHWDGGGYPMRLTGQEIPMGARLVGIADSFDAMTSNRPYRQGMPIERALSILDDAKGTQFDPSLVDAFLKLDEAELAHVVGHSDMNRPLLDCPVCGPVIEMPDELAEVTQCRVCTGKFDIKRESSGKVWVDFNGSYATPDELMPKPNMEHIRSIFTAKDLGQEQEWWERLRYWLRPERNSRVAG